ncbi:hypothetical protein [Pseudomarimonas arenosa]|uniref:Lipoprotein n=1 Tax=Pseudomarimonas arenosa TaxID=2774145 RepID=A0AAW3ZL26_9GAMM|nr:hypothetical protein [Pseudomarimonas arenosa]MBD8525625.1 hypothetical protein [Pseudomarimonas arenosa]
MSACADPLPVQRVDPVQDEVAADVPLSLSAVRAGLWTLFNDGRAAESPNRFPASDRLHLFEAVPLRAASQQQVGAPADHVLRQESALNPALRRYLGLSEEVRGQDLYLYQPTGPHYWDSEYVQDQRVLPFSCQFVVHLREAGADTTRIEVIEVMPQVVMGTKWAFARHGIGIERVPDVQRVAPTTRDRQQLLARILDHLAQR